MEKKHKKLRQAVFIDFEDVQRRTTCQQVFIFWFQIQILP